MKLKQFLDEINAIVEKNPEALEFDVVYSSDDEGNNFDFVKYDPSIGEFKESEGTRGYFHFDSDSKKKNSICIN